jgi:hypothetical protein
MLIVKLSNQHAAANKNLPMGRLFFASYTGQGLLDKYRRGKISSFIK